MKAQPWNSQSNIVCVKGPLSPFLFIIATEALNIVMFEVVEKSIFEGISVRATGVSVSHLQFTGNAIFIGECSCINAVNLINLLNFFKAASGLQIKLHKHRVFGIRVASGKVSKLVRHIHCIVDSLHSLILGFQWEQICQGNLHGWIFEKRFSKKLNTWTANSLCIGGRLTLIMYVLSSLPLYYFSLF